MKSYELSRVHMGRLKPGTDLINGLLQKTEELDVRSGYVKVLGAVSGAVIGFYDQHEKVYHSIEMDEPLEIVTCHGNISVKDDEAALHLHISLANEAGESFGGHLMDGTEVAVAEFCILQFDGQPLEREYDSNFNLDLWRVTE